MRLIVLRATSSYFTRALVVTSPASTTRLSLTSVSAATREVLSCFRIASSTASEIWSATLSGWPSDTDSEVKRKSLMNLAARIPWRRPQGYQICTASHPSDELPASPDRGASARVSAGVGNRPRLDALWDIAHLSSPSSRQPRRRRLRRQCAPAARGDRRRGRNGARAARDLVPAAWRGAFPGQGSAGRRGGIRGARRGQGAALPHAAYGLLRGRGAVRRAARADHRALPPAEGRVARTADACRASARRPAARAGRPRRRAGGVRRAEARRGGRLPARPGPGRGRRRVDRVLRQAGLYRDARRAPGRARQRRYLSRLRAAPAARPGLFDCITAPAASPAG